MDIPPETAEEGGDRDLWGGEGVKVKGKPAHFVMEGNQVSSKSDIHAFASLA